MLGMREMGGALAFVSPGKYSKANLDRAGERIRAGAGSEDDIAMLENWRASHLYVINTFQANLRFRRKRLPQDREITIAQRLKRRPTIIDKLSREQGMMLSRMHDIAGCRLIFQNKEHLKEFRDGVLNSRAAHELVGDRYRYDYIASPKVSGYRGIHDVYKYKAGSVAGSLWDGLRIELQYRTVYQHAWATAVEISDIVNATRLKFSDANRDIARLFVLASEIIARAHEGVPGHCSDLSISDLVNEFEYIESNIHAVGRLRSLTTGVFSRFARSYKLFILINYTSGDRDGTFDVEGFSDNRTAVIRYSELESNLQDVADVVLVGASEQDAVKLAYTNYFSDASLFLTYLDQGLAMLKGR